MYATTNITVTSSGVKQAVLPTRFDNGTFMYHINGKFNSTHYKSEAAARAALTKRLARIAKYGN